MRAIEADWDNLRVQASACAASNRTSTLMSKKKEKEVGVWHGFVNPLPVDRINYENNKKNE